MNNINVRKITNNDLKFKQNMFLFFYASIFFLQPLNDCQEAAHPSEKNKQDLMCL